MLLQYFNTSNSALRISEMGRLRTLSRQDNQSGCRGQYRGFAGTLQSSIDNLSGLHLRIVIFASVQASSKGVEARFSD